MKALSVRQPWAWLILFGGKRIENRTWRHSFRGWCLLHAGLTCDPADAEDYREIIEAVPEPRAPAYRGAIVGAMRIADCVRPDDVRPEQAGWANGPWCFVIDRVRPLLTVAKYPGKLGFFDVPEEQLCDLSWMKTVV